MKKVFILALVLSVMVVTGCSHKNKVANPLANLDSKQPDKVLYDRAMDALQHRQYDISRLTFQTLINTYPDSEFVARAKLGVADSWYAEGTTASLIQAESEYKDFITFFPNMPEAAEAQLKVAGIHYKEMLKPDRDYAHASRAEDEYRQLIQQFPDSKLVPEAKQRLREVQEVLAERQFRIGKFYFGRESYAAAVARLRTLVDQYPLYSNADEALYLLAQSYQNQVKALKATEGNSLYKEKLIGELDKRAAEAYDRIITRYPAGSWADDARQHLRDLSFPVPEPTPEAIAQNQAEIKSRGELGMFARMMDNFKSHPDVSSAAKVGEPSLEDQQPTNATQVVRELGEAMVKDVNQSKATIEQVKPDEVQPNQATPRSDSQDNTTAPANPPDQVNDAAPQAQAQPNQGSSSDHQSSSKKKKKKGIRKIIPFGGR